MKSYDRGGKRLGLSGAHENQDVSKVRTLWLKVIVQGLIRGLQRVQMYSSNFYKIDFDVI